MIILGTLDAAAGEFGVETPDAFKDGHLAQLAEGLANAPSPSLKATPLFEQR
jgi:hypothetical protein